MWRDLKQLARQSSGREHDHAVINAGFQLVVVGGEVARDADGAGARQPVDPARLPALGFTVPRAPARRLQLRHLGRALP